MSEELPIFFFQGTQVSSCHFFISSPTAEFDSFLTEGQTITPGSQRGGNSLMSLLAPTCWCQGASIADNLMENCQKQCYSVCGVVDTREGAVVNVRALPDCCCPLPIGLEPKGNLVHRHGLNLGASQIRLTVLRKSGSFIGL